MPDHSSPAIAAEPRIDEREAAIADDSRGEAQRAPRWVLLALFVLGCALWLMLAEM